MKQLAIMAAGILTAQTAFAGDVTSGADAAKVAAFDILSARVVAQDGKLSFQMQVVGQAGSQTPAATGAFAGAQVLSYVWPTSLDPAAVGFEAGTGILALAATSHPDFDDTPLQDESGDGDKANDGGLWHSHWVVLVPSEDCGPGALSVRDIPEGEAPKMPATWPGVPLFIDSPGHQPVIDGASIRIDVQPPTGSQGARFDGVTAALRVNADLHAPLLCVADVFDVASGDLSLPGMID
jgi:hypothetical protein